MKLDAAALIADLKAKAVPVLEKDLIMVVDAVLDSVQAQALAQAGDVVAGILALGIPALKPVLDAELAKLSAQA